MDGRAYVVGALSIQQLGICQNQNDLANFFAAVISLWFYYQYHQFQLQYSNTIWNAPKNETEACLTWTETTPYARAKCWSIFNTCYFGSVQRSRGSKVGVKVPLYSGIPNMKSRKYNICLSSFRSSQILAALFRSVNLHYSPFVQPLNQQQQQQW